jgi:hypothetical protein
VSFDHPNGHAPRPDHTAELSLILSKRLKPPPGRRVPAIAWVLLAGPAVALLVTAVTPGDVLRWRDPPPSVAEAPPKSVQLRALREHRLYAPLYAALRELSKAAAVPEADRAELAAELRELCSHPLTEVRTEALAAYARWTADDADALARCLAALREPTEFARRAALRLLPRWKDTPSAGAVAEAVAGRLGRPESDAAREVLVALGPAAERAVIPLLAADDPQAWLAAIDVLGDVGGPAAAAALRDPTNRRLHQNPSTHRRALDQADRIDARRPKN